MDGTKRIAVYECCPTGDVSVAALLEGEGREVIACQDGKALMDEVVAHRPDVIVAVLRRECHGDFGVMQLLHRTVPGVPMIFVASDSTLKSERVMRDLRPFYYAVAPVDVEEIGTAVDAALARRNAIAR